jgi:hypothetical protein
MLNQIMVKSKDHVAKSFGQEKKVTARQNKLECLGLESFSGSQVLELGILVLPCNASYLDLLKISD